MKSRLVMLMVAGILAAAVAPAFAQESGEGSGSEPGGTATAEPSVVEPEPYGPLAVEQIELETSGGARVEVAPAGTEVRAHAIFRNVGRETLRDVVVDVQESPQVRVSGGRLTLGDIEPHATADGEFAFTVDEQRCEDFVGFVSQATYAGGELPLKFGVPARCPGPRLYGGEVVYEGGDGDGVPEPGEDLVVKVSLHNEGRDAATDVRGALRIEDPHVTVVRDTATWPDIASGADEAATQGFEIRIAADAPRAEPCGGVGPGPVIVDRVAPPPDEPTSEPASEPPAKDPASEPPVEEQGDLPAQFQGTITVTSSEKTLDVPFGTTIVCALAEGAARGGEPEKDIVAASTSRTGPIALAGVLLAMTAALVFRFRAPS